MGRYVAVRHVPPPPLHSSLPPSPDLLQRDPRLTFSVVCFFCSPFLACALLSTGTACVHARRRCGRWLASCAEVEQSVGNSLFRFRRCHHRFSWAFLYLLCSSECGTRTALRPPLCEEVDGSGGGDAAAGPVAVAEGDSGGGDHIGVEEGGMRCQSRRPAASLGCRGAFCSQPS